MNRLEFLKCLALLPVTASAVSRSIVSDKKEADSIVDPDQLYIMDNPRLRCPPGVMCDPLSARCVSSKTYTEKSVLLKIN